MYVPPLAFVSAFELRIFIPLEIASITMLVVVSALDKFGYKARFIWLNVFRDVSQTVQSEVESVRLIITHLGLNPV